ncbi:MAG TPA: ATP-binding protein [Chryseolinea sp.]|nr:ATP-binding protein [Chryseolinea sp.]
MLESYGMHIGRFYEKPFMRISLIIFFACCCIDTFSQNVEADSLKRLLTTTTDNADKIQILEGLSYAYLATSPDIAMKFANEGLELATKTNNIKGQAICLLALGNVFHTVGDYVKSLEMNFKALELKQALKDQNFAVNYFNIATTYSDQEDHRDAITYIFKAKAEDEKANDSIGIMYDHYSLSAVYLRMHYEDSALYHGDRAYELAKILNDRNLMPAILNNFGEIYLERKELASADKYYHESIPLAMAINDVQVLSMDLLGLAKVYNDTHRPDSAVHYARQALAISNKNNFLKEAHMTADFLKDVFKSTGKFDSALKYMEQSMVSRDSLNSVEKVKKVQNLRLQEQERQHDIEASNLRLQNTIRFYSVLTASLVFLVIAGLLWRNNRQRKKSYAELESQKMKTEEAYEELKSTQTQLIHSEKMASLGELTAGIAHEIQNPLNFVNNFSELNRELIEELKSEITSGETTRMLTTLTNLSENEEKIMHHGKRADSIVKGMLQHSRVSGTQKELLDINVLADDYLRLAYHGLRAKDKSFNAKFETDLDNNIGKVSVIPQEIGRVILNLVNNAFYAVSVKRNLNLPGYEPIVKIKTESMGDEVLISVIDNGVGMSDKVAAKIFQPFYTTKAPGEGTGLGLSLSYDIIKAHNGKIQVKTKEGEGTEFIITLSKL